MASSNNTRTTTIFYFFYVNSYNDKNNYFSFTILKIDSTARATDSPLIILHIKARILGVRESGMKLFLTIFYYSWPSFLYHKVR